MKYWFVAITLVQDKNENNEIEYSVDKESKIIIFSSIYSHYAATTGSIKDEYPYVYTFRQAFDLKKDAVFFQQLLATLDWTRLFKIHFKDIWRE